MGALFSERRTRVSTRAYSSDKHCTRKLYTRVSSFVCVSLDVGCFGVSATRNSTPGWCKLCDSLDYAFMRTRVERARRACTKAICMHKTCARSHGIHDDALHATRAHCIRNVFLYSAGVVIRVFECSVSRTMQEDIFCNQRHTNAYSIHK